MFAAQLQILLYVCLLYNSSLHICACILLDPHQEDHERRECINMESNDQESCFYCAHNLHFHFGLVCGWTNCLPFISHQQKSGETFIHDTWNPIWISFLALLSSHHQLHCPASMWEMCMIYSKSMRLLPQIENQELMSFYSYKWSPGILPEPCKLNFYSYKLMSSCSLCLKSCL